MAAAFPNIYYMLRRTDDVCFDEPGKCSRFCTSAGRTDFLLKCQNIHHYEKRNN